MNVMTTLPLTEAKARLNELVEETMATHERVTITRHGRPAAVLISVDDLESMEETMFWQSQPGIHEDVETARAEKKEGNLYDEAAVRRRYGLRTTR
jgi:antitoxin YefM